MGHANLEFWKAWEHRLDSSGMSGRRTLIVTGKVEVDAAATPILEEEIGRGSEPKTLRLKFSTLKTANDGNSWKQVWFQKEIQANDYEYVQLLIPQGSPATGGRLKIEK